MNKPGHSSSNVCHDPNTQQPMTRVKTRPMVTPTAPYGPADSAGPEIPRGW